MKSQIFKRGLITLLLSFLVCHGLVAQAQQRTTSTRTGNTGSYRSTSGGSGYRSSAYNSGSSRSYNNNTMVGDATITSDPETRRIIVITDEETAANISEVISNLDRPKPQVLIKVVFLEVSHTDGKDIGVESSYTKNISSEKSVGLTNMFGFGNPANSLVTTPGTGMYSIVGSDFSATLRAIQSAGKIEVLSRPSIMVRNNQTATITVGQEIPLVTSTTYNNYIGQINNITYKDVGVILTVTPFITSDGLVQMIVAPETSSLSSQTVSLGGNSAAPIIDTRSANTVVVTPDRQTVVIGGLMQDSKQKLESKIPLLGDIPLLGNLFKRKQSLGGKVELVIFLTPYVVAAPNRLASITDKESRSLDLAPQAFSEKELDHFLEGVPFKKPETRNSLKKEDLKKEDSKKDAVSK